MNKGTNWRKLTIEEWNAEGEAKFGPDKMQWRFKCPCCGHVASVADYKDAGASEGMAAFSCIGRCLPKAREALGEGPGPCNYAGGGLFQFNPVIVGEDRCFEFADAESPGPA